MSFEDFLDDIAGEAITTFGTTGGRQLTLVFGGRTVPFYEEDELIKHELVLGGMANNSDLVIRCRKRDFHGPLPIKNGFVSIDGEQWKCASIEATRADPEARLTLVAGNRKK